MTGHGCFAEFLVAERVNMVKLPADMPLDIAVGFTMTYGTSLHALKQRAQLQPGERCWCWGLPAAWG